MPHVAKPKGEARPKFEVGLRLTILLSTIAGASIVAAAIVLAAWILHK